MAVSSQPGTAGPECGLVVMRPSRGGAESGRCAGAKSDRASECWAKVWPSQYVLGPKSVQVNMCWGQCPA